MQMGYSVQDQVYLTLRKKILNFELVPGTTMSTQELADQLRVSRTPVREALIRLQRDGLVVILPQRETMVTRIDMDRAAQERFMRKSLELSVLEVFIRQTDFEQLKGLNDLIEKQLAAGVDENYEDLLAYDDAFHRTFFEHAGQRLSWDVLEQMNTHYRRVRLLSLKEQSIAKTIVLQHVELLKSVENSDAEQAKQILGEHLQKLDREQIELRNAYPDFFEDLAQNRVFLSF